MVQQRQIFFTDDFTVPTVQNWNITSIDFFAYQIGYTGTTSPFNTINVKMFNSDPSVLETVSDVGR